MKLTCTTFKPFIALCSHQPAILTVGAAAPLHIESPWQAEAAQAGATQQGVADSAELLDAEAPADSEPKEAAELVTDELEGPDAADTNATELVDKTQQALAGKQPHGLVVTSPLA